MGDDPEKVEERQREPEGEHAEPESTKSLPARNPAPRAADRERDLLLRRAREQRDCRECDEPFLVEEPHRVEHERNRDRNRMEAVRDRECAELRRRKEKVGKGKVGTRTGGAQVLACEPEDRQRSARDRERLHDRKNQWARPDPKERDE